MATDKLVRFVARLRQRNIEITATIWLQTLVARRFTRRNREALEILDQLLGEEALSSLFFATTFWDEVPNGLASSREAELVGNVWKRFLNSGGRYLKLENHHTEMAVTFLQTVLTQAPRISCGMKVLTEMSPPYTDWHNTTIGVFLGAESFEDRTWNTSLYHPDNSTYGSTYLEQSTDAIYARKYRSSDRIKYDGFPVFPDPHPNEPWRLGLYDPGTRENITFSRDEVDSLNRLDESQLQLRDRQPARESVHRSSQRSQHSITKSKNIQPRDPIIAVLGITGSGKSTFVQMFTDEVVPISDGLDSCKRHLSPLHTC